MYVTRAMDRRSVLATGCLGVAAAWAWWTIRCHLVELKRELQEVKRSLVPLPRQPQPTAKRQWPNLSGVWEFDASRADLKAIDIYLRYMSTPMMIRPIFSYAMSRMKVRRACSVWLWAFAGAQISCAASPLRALS